MTTTSPGTVTDGSAGVSSAESHARPATTETGWLTPADCRLEDFRAVVEQETRLEEYPLADTVRDNVLVYGDRLRERLRQPGQRRPAQAELARALMDGPGVVVLAGAFDPAIVDDATAVLEELLTAQKAAGLVSGDHFAQPGANERIWGALGKFAARAPGVFAEYYANDLLALICEAWLGRGYQMTSQPNVVNPGGKAQVAHRDYHLGFMDRAQAEAFPVQAHRLTPVLTLQGAVAHCDMPVISGPTMFLPHSQKYRPGYLAFHFEEFTAYFDDHYVQLPLIKGDAVFFNPALFHGAGTNRSAGIRRMANLLQVSSAFGRPMETEDTAAVSRAVFGVLKAWRAGGRDENAIRNVITVAAEGYAFPTNLDRDPPVDGMAPRTQAELLAEAVDENWDDGRLATELAAMELRRSA